MQYIELELFYVGKELSLCWGGENIDIWEPEGRFHYSMMFHWEPEGHNCCTKSVAIAPFWFSTEHRLTSLTPFWFSTDNWRTNIEFRMEFIPFDHSQKSVSTLECKFYELCTKY